MSFLSTAAATQSSSTALNIVLPVGGVGQRFQDEGYPVPKPFVRALGKPILAWNLEHLNLHPDDTLHVVYRKEYAGHGFEQTLAKAISPHTRVRFTPLDHDTRGAAETVLIALGQMTGEELGRPTLVVDVDNVYPEDIVSRMRAARGHIIFHTNDTSPDPIYSYLSVADGRVVDIREKVKISDHACVGAYGFRDGFSLARHIRTLLDRGLGGLREFYLSAVFQLILEAGEDVLAGGLEGFYCLGTPRQVRAFCRTRQSSAPIHHFTLDLSALPPRPETPDDRALHPEQVAALKGFLHLLETFGQSLSCHHTQALSPGDASGPELARTCLLANGLPILPYRVGGARADYLIPTRLHRVLAGYEKEFGFYGNP